MARRKRTSAVEDLIDLVAMLPWWVGVVLALVSYLLFHSVASQPALGPVQLGQLGAVVTHSIWLAVANVAQYLVPVFCLAGAGLSAMSRHKRKRLVDDVTRSKAGDALDGMSWREFEMLVGEAFRLQGYRVVETGGGGPDGGIDLVLTRPGKNGSSEKYLVQCKQWRAFKVGVDVVRELYGVMAAKGAAGGFVVTSGRFTDDAVQFATGRNMNLIDGPKLHGLIRQAQAQVDLPAARPKSATSAPTSKPDAASASVPSCPLCSKPMARRLAKRGANAGAEFWGCTAYPACRGTRPIA
ncbi:MAG: restriction endonuclease [Burkholderiales bacterium]|nr:restriction endonuclease [Burkholderiales bacterium]MDE1926126.1 restriction endonuclease [Burkholderiales bacterium]MDE2158729.1 restriction endonuclease [Burkholderiales bacterium]